MRPRIIHVLNDFFHTHLFGYVVPTSEVIYALMLSALIVLFIKRCKSAGLDKYHAAGIALWCSIGAVVGGRLFYIVQHLSDTLEQPSSVFDTNGGLVSFGGYLGCALGAVFYARVYVIPFLNYTDVLASIVGLGPCIGRMACLLNGDDYGTITAMPWGIRYPNSSIPFVDQLNHGLVGPFEKLSVAVHPVQIYESIAGLMLFVWFSYLWKQKILRPGVLSILFWLVYGVCRFVIEFFRGDENRGWVGPMSLGQFTCLLMVGAALATIAYGYRFRIATGNIS